ncbi:cysteine desulfurase family protein [Paenibacillus lentus]|uniref:Cysteine desulfurase n=1 Tax=Paenibacillus lentus TaxID=1338368 RepID=A0A3Q8S503_9BACL|nr:cysteine desulfurase family protein [Paenibacillus lentus]AZK46858.1 cysteine desulfurase [Paenibacillus lentus]
MKYFDHAATTPPREDVIRTVTEVMAQHFGNPSSLHRLGEDSSKLLSKAREVCANVLQVKPGEIVFTSGATESNNLAIRGIMSKYRHRGNHIVTTSIEHPSVFETCRQLEKEGCEVTYVPVQPDGTVTAEDVLSAVRNDTVLVTVMHVNNETGSIQPIEEIGKDIKSRHPLVFFHVDGVQAFGKLPLSIRNSRIDLYSLSAHKFRGPKGAGLLYVREGVSLAPLLTGGGQEGGLRSGTENIPYIVGMAKAVRLAAEQQPHLAKQLAKLNLELHEGLQHLGGLEINSSPQGAPHIVHFSYPGMKAETMLHMLEEEGFFVSTQSACSSKRSEPSRVLLAMNKEMDCALSGIRISLGEEHTEEDIRQLLRAIERTMERLQRVKGGNS